MRRVAVGLVIVEVQLIESLLGRVIAEVSEMSGYSKMRSGALKAFVSRDVDRSRLKFRQDAEEFERRCSVVGTTNDLEILKADPSGQRRFAVFGVEPVLGSVAELIAEVGGARDAIWARAYRLVNEEDYDPALPDDLRAVHELASAAHVGSFDDEAAGWVEKLGGIPASLEALATGAGVPEGQTRRFARELRRHGWEPRRSGLGARERLWHPPETA